MAKESEERVRKGEDGLLTFILFVMFVFFSFADCLNVRTIYPIAAAIDLAQDSYFFSFHRLFYPESHQQVICNTCRKLGLVARQTHTHIHTDTLSSHILIVC